VSQPQRPDQRQLGTSRAGSGPAPASQFVFARVVVISGTGEVGLFEYTGTPGLGNPPILYAVPPGTTTDPYGNPLPASGGIVSDNPGVALAQLATGALFLELTGAADTSAQAAAFGISGSASGQAVTISSGKGAEAGAASSSLVVADSGAEASGNMPAVQVLDASDGNTYDTETLRLDAIGTQTINTAANTVITGTSGTGLSCPVAARKYQVTGRVAWQQVTAAVAQEFGFTGPTVSSMDIACDQWEQAGTGQQIFSGNITAIGGHVSTPAVGLGIITAFRFEGELTFSAAGTFAVVALEGTPGDSFTVNPSGAIAWMTVSPV
jgi:hypothetical protein